MIIGCIMVVKSKIKLLTKKYKTMKTLAIILVALISTINISFAQKGSIKGTVTDKETSDPVNSAKIVLLKEKLYITKAYTDKQGNFELKSVDPGTYSLKVEHNNYKSIVKNNVIVNANKTTTVNLSIKCITIEVLEAEEEIVLRDECKAKEYRAVGTKKYSKTAACIAGGTFSSSYDAYQVPFNTESYDVINENMFKDVMHNPLSTFSIDVDRAAYANVRRFLNNNQKPIKDAVRIEEMINYFEYSYPQPTNGHPFSVTMEMGECPWDKNHQLALIGLQGEDISTEKIPAGNLVFLIDVSGSMGSPNKLPLLKQAFKILVENLRPEDRVAIVVYAGAAGCVLESTPGTQKTKIIEALDRLQSGGSTAGGAGIKLAYKIAKENFIKDGNNRVILATDGDFNIGASSNAEMVRLIEEKRDDGVFLSILGFGMGNYKDSKMEQISNAGNGNYAYIDNILEAKKVFGKELWGTLYTIAKDVKIQIEFNPSKIKAYRLIGYENRLLNKEDFNDDKKDAGEIGSGHSVTALYEIILADSEEEVNDVDPLEYQKASLVKSNNLMTVKLRYKKPDEDISNLIVERIKEGDMKSSKLSDNFKFASAVAEFGMLLRDSEHKAGSTYSHVLALAKESKGSDADGYKSEFIKLVETAELMAK